MENTNTQRRKLESPIFATDLIIEYTDNVGKYGIVLIDRKNYPYGLALPGGIYEKKDQITLEENAIKEGNEETGLEIIIQNPNHPLTVRSSPYRDPRDHIVSVTYVTKGYGILKPRPEEDAKAAYLFSIDEIVNMIKTKRNTFAFRDHPEILEEYLIQKEYIKK